MSRLKLTILSINLLTLVIISSRIIQLPFKIPGDYNEGWNAYLANRALNSLPLYPPLSEPISNNYPPLSFHLVGWLGRLLGDNIVAGRLVSLVSLLAIAGLVAWIVKVLTKQGVAALLSATLVMGTFTFNFYGYVAMNDPQMLAHGLQIAALALLLTKNSLLPSALLMAVSLGVKHNVLALPSAIVLWLMFYHPRDAIRYLLTLAGGVLGLYSLFYVSYGSTFVDGILKTPRTYEFTSGLLKMRNWLKPQVALLGLSTLGFYQGRAEKVVHLFGLYAAISIAISVLFAGGAGTDYNLIFDVAIACSFLSAWAFVAPNARIKFEVALILLVAVGVLYVNRVPRFVDETLSPLQMVAPAAEDIELIADHENPVICEQLALCYWAGKPFEADLFNLGQKLRVKTASLTDWQTAISQQRYSLLSFLRGSYALPAEIFQEVENSYQVVEESNLQKGNDLIYWEPKP